jgi:hypothetical protein
VIIATKGGTGEKIAGRPTHSSDLRVEEEAVLAALVEEAIADRGSAMLVKKRKRVFRLVQMKRAKRARQRAKRARH